MQEYTIYKVTNMIDNTIYIGATMDYNRRIKEHRRARTTSTIHTAIRVYGFDNFKFERLVLTDNAADASAFEDYYIDLYDSINYGYNEVNVSSNNIGPQSYEACLKKRLAKLGKKRKPFTPEHINNMKLARRKYTIQEHILIW
jgi:group I intron endonuclease